MKKDGKGIQISIVREHPGPLKKSIGFCQENPAQEGRYRRPEAEDQQGQAGLDFHQGLEQTEISQEKPNDA